MKGENLLILTNGGGVGVLATDSAEHFGIPLKFAPPDLQDELKKHMPEFGSARNPVDLTGMAPKEWYYETVKICLTHPWVNGLVILYCETSLTVPSEIAEHVARAIVDSGVRDKPVTVAVIGGEQSAKAMKFLMEKGIPAYEVPDKAVDAMAALNEYAKILAMTRGSEPPKPDPVAEAAARSIIRSARAAGRTALTEVEAKHVFSAYGLPVTKTTLALTEDEAVDMAEAAGFPVVLKIVSPDILHKSDAGGVKVNIKDKTGVRDAFQAIMRSARVFKSDAEILGVAVQEMAPPGLEIILGIGQRLELRPDPHVRARRDPGRDPEERDLPRRARFAGRSSSHARQDQGGPGSGRNPGERPPGIAKSWLRSSSAIPG